MIVLCGILAGLLVVSVAIHLFVGSSARRSLLKTALRDRFVVTLVSGDAFNGLLAEVDAQTLILDDASLHANGAWVPADGRVFLARQKVAYMQRVTRQVADS